MQYNGHEKASLAACEKIKKEKYYPDEDKYSLISSAYKIRIITNVECLQSCFVDENNNIYELCKSIGGYKIWVECGKFNNRWKK